MPANGIDGVRAVTSVVHHAATFSFSRTITYAEVTAIPGGGTELQLPDQPAGGDSYAWVNPDNSCGESTPITLTLSARAIAAGITLQGGEAEVFQTPGASGTVVFFDASNSWSLFIGSAANQPQTPWTQPIDGAGFPLEHVATVTFDTFDNGNSGSAITIDWRRSQKQLLTLTADCTLAFVDPPGAGNFLLVLIQGGTGGHGVTFPAEVGWQGSLVPTPTSAPQAMDAAALAFLPAGLPAPFRYLGSFGPNFGV
jgi:hypothetical protein